MKVSEILLQVISLAAVVSGAAVQKPNPGPTVDLGYASYHGTRLAAGVDQYLGMRYARAPLGKLRFRAPQKPARLCKPQDATEVCGLDRGVLRTGLKVMAVSSHLCRGGSDARPRH